MSNNILEEIIKRLEENLTDEQRNQLDELRVKMEEIEDLLVQIIIPEGAVYPPSPKEAENKLILAANVLIDNAFIKMIKEVNERWPKDEYDDDEELEPSTNPETDRTLN